MIPPVVASDRGRAQTAVVATQGRCCRTTSLYYEGERNVLERAAGEGESPVRVIFEIDNSILSSTGHEKPCVNSPGPSGKAKYY